MTVPCFKFRASEGNALALSIDESGKNLTAAPAGHWQLLGHYHRRPTPAGETDEIYDELDKQGFVVWSPKVTVK